MTPTLGVTLYSFTNPYHARKTDLDGLLEYAAAQNFGPAIEVVGFQSFRHFPAIDDTTAAHFRERISALGLTANCLSINSDVSFKRGEFITEDESVAYHEAQLRAAHKLGCRMVRYQYGAGVRVVERVLPLAERLGVAMGMEIHAPETVDSPTVMEYRELYARLNSPLLGFVPDFGGSARQLPQEFLRAAEARGVPPAITRLAEEIWAREGSVQDRRGALIEAAKSAGARPDWIGEIAVVFNILGHMDPRKWVEIVPQVHHIHGKFYWIGENGEDGAIDYDTCLGGLVKAGFSGTISSEWEGHLFSDDDGFDQVARHQALCRRVIAANLPAGG